MKSDCLFRMGREEESIAVLDKRLLFNSGDRWATLCKATHLALMDRHKEALLYSHRHIRLAREKKNPTIVYNAYHTKGFVLEMSGEYRKALKIYQSITSAKGIKKDMKDIAKSGIERCIKAI